MYNQNSGAGNGAQQAALAEKNRQRNEIQRDIVMQEADWRKKVAEKGLIEAEIRALKKDEDRLRTEMQVRQVKFNRIEQEVMQMDAEIKNLKKKLNTII